MGYTPSFKTDLFFSYARDDDAEWMEKFSQELRTELVRLVGRSVDIWRDEKKLRFGQDWQEEIDEAVRGAALFMAVCSPSYYRSDWCDLEWRAFFDQNKATEEDPSPLKIGETGAYRLVKAVIRKTHPFFPTLQHTCFHDADGIPYAADSPEFRKEIQRMAAGIETMLEALRRGTVGVFVGAPAADMRADGRALKNELKQSDFDVRPDFNLSAAQPTALDPALEGSKLAVFVLGSAYDRFTRRQIERAREMKIPVAFWVNPRIGAQPDDEQKKLIAELEEQGNSALTGLSVLDVAAQVVGRLRHTSQPPPAAANESGVFLLFDSTTPADSAFAAETLTPMITEQGLSVHTPHAKSPYLDPLQDREAFLEQFEGVLLYGNQAPDRWIRPNVMELSVATTAKGCVLRPAHADLFAPFLPVIKQSDDFNAAKLQPFFAQVERARAAHGGR